MVEYECMCKRAFEYVSSEQTVAFWHIATFGVRCVYTYIYLMPMISVSEALELEPFLALEPPMSATDYGFCLDHDEGLSELFDFEF